jgi:uncharacterized membrane-anchored protein
LEALVKPLLMPTYLASMHSVNRPLLLALKPKFKQIKLLLLVNCWVLVKVLLVRLKVLMPTCLDKVLAPLVLVLICLETC